MMTYQEALKCAICGDTVFVVGSGFSIGAENKLEEEDRRLWVGSKLAQELAKLTDMDIDVQLDIVSQEYIDIYGEKQLVNYLKEHYTVERYEDYYKALAKIKNIKVYSTNYDNLIESVCRDCGNKVKGYGIDADIRKVNKDKMVIHLNGYIEDLNSDILPESFKLSHLSYNNTRFFDTPWYSYLIDELHSAKAIFIIGLSFSSDLDIRRILSDEELRDKIFFVESENLSHAKRKFLDKYGRVLLCGVQNFFEDLSSIEVEKDMYNKKNNYKTFRKINRHENVFKAEDRDIYNLFFKGIERDEIYKRDANRRFETLVNRDKLFEVADGLNDGKSYIIYSDLGNGKSIFINQVVDLCPNLEFYFIKQVINQKLLNEIKNFCKDEKQKVIVCDPANLFMDILNKFADFDLCNIRFLLVLRSPMYDNYYNNIYDIIEKMGNVKFMNSINLDILNEKEIHELDALIMEYGFYGDMAGFGLERRINFLEYNDARVE